MLAQSSRAHLLDNTSNPDVIGRRQGLKPRVILFIALDHDGHHTQGWNRVCVCHWDRLRGD